ncbi:hypothetical protein J5N97_002907 [Dioscorea zingiberensis]|uniref:ABC transporter domain-containing protein n=1 Tax=Dioscorea zingiberensis TaxID=325984 RepID=A0A9D5D3N0_9LILI|nr:hypothetical protein J5N97_002907 [Dioscorea zingiberensis]
MQNMESSNLSSWGQLSGFPFSGSLAGSIRFQMPEETIKSPAAEEVMSQESHESDESLTGGAFLSWEDLWVMASDGKGRQLTILGGISGYAQPGEVLAIMGPSGCGKSTLLDTLAGRLQSNARQKGNISVNGRKQTLSFGTSAYVTQDDTLMTTMTVREAVHYSAQLQLPNTMTVAQKKERAETTIREMGLRDAADTRIGGWVSKGISGGQKRRREGITVLTAIHQPSSEVFELFHNLCLLSSGNTVYFGPANMTNEEIEDDHGDYEEGKTTASAAKATEILVKSYSSSTTCQEVTQRIAFINEKERRSQASFLAQSLVLIKKILCEHMYRDLGYYYWLRFAIYVALCLCVGTIYYDIGHDYGSIQARGSMLMFVAAFLTFMAIGGFPSFVEDMKIFGRERLNGHYGVVTFVIGNTVSSIPYLALISIVPGAIAYYLVGLQKSFQHFAYFALVLFVCMMLVESLMMMVASIVPDFLMGIITGAGIQGVMMLNGGFFRLPRDLPKPMWRYPMYYIAFHKYANQGFYKNEFLGLTFPNTQAGGPPTISGEEILRDVWQVEMGYSKWVDLAILFGMVIIYRVLFLVIIKFAEKMKPKVKVFFSRLTTKSTRVIDPPPAASLL